MAKFTNEQLAAMARTASETEEQKLENTENAVKKHCLDTPWHLTTMKYLVKDHMLIYYRWRRKRQVQVS